MIRVSVPLAAQPYEVIIGDGSRHLLADELARVAPGATSCVLVTQDSLLEAGWLEGLETGLTQHLLTIPEGEDAKSLTTVERLASALVDRGLSRRDVLVAVGGGLVSDVVGFVASTYHRGIGYVTLSTSLLGQVDAAIGGKTGVNLPEGKNLVGTFWQPLVVLCDTEVLSTLPEEEWACGRGEMAKYAFLGDEQPSTALLSEPLDVQVATCVAIKAAVVAEDERDGGRRMLLNYGHTLGHGLEAVGLERRAAGIDDEVTALRHGQAVAIGVLYAALLARRLGRIDDERVALHRAIVEGFELKADLPAGLDAPALLAAMGRDKKADHDLTFVLDGPQGVEVVTGVGEAEVLATLVEMGARP